MALSPFDISKNILNKERHLNDDELQGYSSWMVNKIFSCSEQYAFVAHAMSRSNITDRMNYDFYFQMVKKNPKLYIPYTAKKQKTEKEIQYIMDYYQCSQEHAKQYHGLISKEDLDFIIKYNEHRGVKK